MNERGQDSGGRARDWYKGSVAGVDDADMDNDGREKNGSTWEYYDTVMGKTGQGRRWKLVQGCDGRSGQRRKDPARYADGCLEKG